MVVMVTTLPELMMVVTAGVPLMVEVEKVDESDDYQGIPVSSCAKKYEKKATSK
jgi:hypothetical protein